MNNRNFFHTNLFCQSLHKVAMALTLLVVLGCNDTPSAQSNPAPAPPQPQGGGTLDSINKTLQDLAENLGAKSSEYGRQVQGMAKEEYIKLIKFDYKVVDLPRNSKATEVEEVLTQLGEERWNCFHVDNFQETTRFYCRRLPFSVLRFAPYLW